MSTPGKASMVLGLAVLIALAILMLVNNGTKERIEQAHQQMRLDNLSSVLPEGPFDTNPVESMRTHVAQDLGGDQEIEFFTAYRDGTPVAAVLELIAPDGYSGNITMLLGIKADGAVIAARVVEHRETPGLGDRIEYRKSKWITQFNGESITVSVPENWQTRQSGGQYDALSGATITSAAIIQSLHRALQWFAVHHNEVFSQ